MKRLSCLIYCIISFGFGSVIGYFIMGYVDILKLVVAGVSAGLTIQAIQTYKEIKEKRLIHSKVLLDNNLKYRTTSVGLANNATPDLSISVNSSSSYIIDYKRYSKDVDAHLESEYYEEVVKHEKERDSFIKNYNPKAIKFKEYLTEKIKSEVNYSGLKP